jgi:hypothetical protein
MKARGLIFVVGALIALVAAGCGSSGDDSGSPGAEGDETEADSGAVTGKVPGRFIRGGLDTPIDEGDLLRYIKTADVYCGWQEGKVVVHVKMTNKSAEHVTVNWYPRYKIKGGGVHGAGFGAVQSDGFDSGEVRELLAEQEPEGVSGTPAIDRCFPAFQLIESG